MYVMDVTGKWTLPGRAVPEDDTEKLEVEAWK